MISVRLVLKSAMGVFKWITTIVHVDVRTPDEYCIGKIYDNRKVKVRWRKQSAEELSVVVVLYEQTLLYRPLYVVIVVLCLRLACVGRIYCGDG